MSQQKFVEYISKELAEQGLQNGSLVVGVLRVNPKRPADGFCVTGKGDVLIRGKFDRNRAFNGDTIVVELLPQNDWHGITAEDIDDIGQVVLGGKHDFVIPDAEEKETILTELRLQERHGETVHAVTPTVPTTMAQALVLLEPSPGVIKTGRVVYVAHAVWKERVFACSLHPNRNHSADLSDETTRVISKEENLIRAVPIDKRIPWILIMLNDTVRKVLKLPGELSPHILYPIQVQKWDVKGALPLGRLKGVAYGKVGEPSVEAKVCMAEQDLKGHEEDFPNSVHMEVERMQENFEEELQREARSRIDLRQKRICTIDPRTARDLDDAIHIDVIDNDFVEIGVHIADVSHYVQENSQLDKIAQERCTSVYLAHRVYPMLPEGLSNSLCSLNANEAKLTFSAWFRIRRSTGEVILDSKDKRNGPRFAKTIIQSCCRLSYEEAQDILDEKSVLLADRPLVFGSHDWEDIVKDMHLLYDICAKVRKRRFANGSVRIDKMKMRFELNSEDVPIGYNYESHSPSHWMIEELMLLANEVVAKKVSDIGQHAVLRKHPSPDAKSFSELSDKIQTDLGIAEWSGHSSKALYESLKLVKQQKGKAMGQLVEFLVMKTMRPAQYCLMGEGDNSHYALAFEWYTHFTSPIRRYPDIMVHRQLQLVLELGAIGIPSPDIADELKSKMEAQCDLCNIMKKKSREAQEACDVAFFCIYLRKKAEFHITAATVISIKDKCINVYIAKLGKDCPVYYTLVAKPPRWYMQQSVSKRAELDLIMKGPKWDYVDESLTTALWTGEDYDEEDEEVQEIRLFEEVTVAVIPLDTVPISFAVLLLPPSHPRSIEFGFMRSPSDTSEDPNHADVV